MQLNYFGSLRLIMGLLPGMAQRHRGHIINISSIGVLTSAPHGWLMQACTSKPASRARREW